MPLSAAEAQTGDVPVAAIGTRWENALESAAEVPTKPGDEAVQEAPSAPPSIPQDIGPTQLDEETPSAEPASPAVLIVDGDETGSLTVGEAHKEIALVGASANEAADIEPAGVRAPKAPGPYRPRLREKAHPEPARPTAETLPSPDRAAGSGAFEADLVLAFRPGGWGMDLSLLLRRLDGMPEQIVVKLGGLAVELSAIDDGLFEAVQLTDPSAALRSGIAAETIGKRWVRTGRRLHVFTERAGLFGFTSVPRVVIGQENVILCENDIADRVLELCGQAGLEAPAEAAGPGLPDGWRCFRAYWPQHPWTWDGEDIYLALSPLPDAAIEFTGGVSTSRSTWIFGRPPSIRILGAVPADGDVSIDGRPAACSAEGRWTAPGWDEPGSHAVRYAGLLRRYEIVQADVDWEWWPAHAGSGSALAGAFASLDGGRCPAFVLEEQGAWLLGARPGEIAWAPVRPGSAGALASPGFRPVWAIPSQTRRRPAPQLLDFAVSPQSSAPVPSAEAVRLWCQAIRDASDVPAAADAATTDLWRSYKAASRSLKRWAR